MRTTLVVLLLLVSGSATAEPLSSWNDGPVKKAITNWLAAVTDPDGGDFIPVAERVAVFDNDGTSWCERPDYAATSFQVSLAGSMAAQGKVDPDDMPFKAWFADDRDALREYGFRQAYIDLNASCAGMPVSAYRDSARAWLDRQRHSRYGVRFTDLYFAPMLELKDLLVAHGFQVWIVTGAAQDFVRSYSEQAIGIPPERVIGTWTTPVYEKAADGTATLVRGAVQTYNGHENKPAHIEQRIGRRPVFAAGNSNNDQAMCRYAVTGERRGMALWIHHDDSAREYDYDRSTKRIAELCARHPGAFEVSIKKDWTRVFRDVSLE
ncbi:MAG: haloacid dehalogenase-like hydrolase [Candidatus Krumholzibacteriota bacterium]